MKTYCENVYDKGVEFTSQMEQEVMILVRQALTYKMGSLRIGMFLRRSFEKKGLGFATVSFGRTKFAVLSICILNLIVAGITAYFDIKQY